MDQAQARVRSRVVPGPNRGRDDPAAPLPRAADQTILVAGAAGLLGRELVRQLSALDVQVRGVDASATSPISRAADSGLPDPAHSLGASPPVLPTFPRSHFSTGDLLDPETCRRACDAVDIVIHAAAVQYHDAVPRWGCERFFQQNVRLARNIVQAACDAGVHHLIMVSSDMVYGLPRRRPIREDDPLRPIGPYGRSKVVAEAIYRQAALRGVCVTILRPRLIIGPGRLGVLRRLFDRVRDDKAIPIVGDPKNRYQMVSVRDVAAACLLALRDSVAGTFNLGSDNPPGVRDLIRTLRDRAGSSSRIVTVPRAAAHAGLWLLESARCAPLRAEQFRLTGRDCVLDTTRARDLLGWRPQDSDVEMLCQAYRAYVERAADFSRRG